MKPSSCLKSNHVSLTRISRLSAGLFAAALLFAGLNAGATIVGPYTADAYTLHLWHLDETTVPCVDSVASGGTNLVDLATGATLGNPSYSSNSISFGNALNTAAGGGGKGDLLAASPTAGNVTITLADPTTGAFTFEAIVQIGFDPTISATTQNEIMAGESGTAANRVFQWRILPKGATLITGIVAAQPYVTFENVRQQSAGQNTIYAAIPTTGSDAIVSNGWYHVAVTYNGQPGTANNIIMYWTLLDPSRVAANPLTITSVVTALTGLNPLSTVTTTFMLGNQGRNKTGNFLGAIDEVRISSVARAAWGMMFATDPQIISQPRPVTTNYGASATFTAVVQTTNPPLTYAWYKGSTLLVNGLQAGGSTVSGAQGTNSGSSLTATLTLTNVSYQDDGSYSLFVTNNANNFVSTIPATLTVNDPYIVTQPPLTIVVPVGGATTIPVVAAGSGPITYQWYSTSAGQLSDGADISGSQTPILTITNAQRSDGGNYYVMVTGASGSSAQSSNEIVYVESTQLGPFDPSDWPASIAPNAQVDYAIFDPNNSFSPPPGWNNVMSLTPSGGDQTFVGITYGGLYGNEGTSVYFNFVDPNWASFVNVPVIDILVQVYGNSAIYNADGTGLSLTFQEGQVGYGHNVRSVVPQGANNGQWNWMLFEIANPIDPLTGFRYVGDTSHSTQSGGTYGGVNVGTIRCFGGSGSVNGITIRAVALGPQGAFGTTNQVNRFATPTNCPPETNVNLAYVDFNSGVTNHLTVLTSDNLGEPLGYNLQSGVGPAGDLRTAIQSSSYLMNFAILSNYLGQPCNPALSMQLCIEFYDDPNLAGSSFGPYQYATDAQGDLANYDGSPYTLTGSGRWLKVAFYLGPVCLEGVGTAPLTGGPTVIFNGNYPYIDRVELGVIQQGTNALAGLTPDPNYHMDPFICDTNYGYYAEWNPNGGVTNNVDIAPGYTAVLAGPSYDLRLAEKANLAAPGVYYLQFALLNNVFGPALQDNADVTMLVTYYDDPALVGAQIFPNIYETWIDGNSSPITPSAPYNVPVTLQGSGQWKDAYFELPNVNFVPNSVCRYATYASGPVYVSRVRYDVIRPCGSFEGINYLQTLRITGTNTNVNVNWFGTAALQSAQTVAGLYSSVVTVTNTLTNSYTPPATNNAEFFRLQYPGYPPYLSTNTP